MSNPKQFLDDLKAAILAEVRKLLREYKPDLSKSANGPLPTSQVPQATASDRGGVVLSNTTPSAVGTAAAGSATDVSRHDHVHAHGNQAGGSLHSAATTSALGFVELATDGETASGVVVQGNDGRLSNARTPTDHNHTSAGGDGGVLTNDAHDGYSDYTEIATPSAPGANTARLFVRDNGGGKTELCVLFPSGSAITIALEA